MRVALICPVSMMTYQQMTNMQLVLPHIKYPEYWENIRWFRARGDHLILDNGAAEKVSTSIEELVKIALQYRVSEIAIPDTLGDLGASMTQVDDFFSHGDEVAELLAAGIKIGYVSQGDNGYNAQIGVKQVMDQYGDYVSTIFVPRLLVRAPNQYARLDVAHWVNNVYPDLDIHLFGAASSWPREVMAASREASFIRSIDTSMPFNYTIAQRLMAASSMQGPSRINDFFEWDPVAKDLEWSLPLAQQNIKAYLEWARYGE